MADFGPLGGVKITGFISPVDTADEYAVIDPLYGIDGFRNLSGDTLELNNISQLRRRAGMIVGVSNGGEYYKLKDKNPWDYDATAISSGTDWDLVSFGNDIFVSGITFSDVNYDLTIHRNDGVNLTQNLSTLASDIYVLNGVYNPITGVVEFTNTTGGTFNVSGFTTGVSNFYTTGGTLVNSNLIFDRTDSLSAYTIDLNNFSTSFSFITGFTTDDTLTITHNLGVGDECSVIINDLTNNKNIGGVVDNFQTNSVDVTLSETFTSVKITIIK